MSGENSQLNDLYLKLTQLDLQSLTFHNRIIVQDMLNSLSNVIDLNTSHKEIEKNAKFILPKKSSSSNFKLMVVDDDEDTIRLIQYALKNEPINLVSFTNPEVALEKISTEKPDLILLDFMMPEMTGIEFLIELKERDILKDLTVVIGSAKNNSQDKANALKLGANDYIVKPYDLTELKLKINKYKEKNVA